MREIQTLISESDPKIAIKLDLVNKVYGDKVPKQALYDISMKIRSGSINCIKGHSGSGKSTLMNLIGLIDRPSSGQVDVLGVDVSLLEDRELSLMRNKYMGYIFQSHFLLPEFNVKENILMPHWIAHRKKVNYVESHFNQIIFDLQLTDLIHNSIYELSGGQLQRVAIARSLINSPKIILADEPAANLDSNLSTEVFDLLQQINKNYGVTVLIITHKMTEFDGFDQVFTLMDGRLIDTN